METWAKQPDRSAAQRPRRQDNRSQQSQLPRPRQPALSLESTQIHPQRPQQLAYATASTTVEAERVLLHATARLALETSHKVRTLQAIAVRTLTVPDTCSVGNLVSVLAMKEHTYSPTEHAFRWAQLILILLKLPRDNLPASAAQLLEAHAQANTALELAQ